MIKIRKGCGAVLLIAIGFVGGISAGLFYSNTVVTKRLAERLDGGQPIRPTYLQDIYPCSKATDAAVNLDEAMLNTARASLASGSTTSPVSGYVVSYFAWHWSQASQKERCQPSNEIVRQLAPILDRISWPQANKLALPWSKIALAEVDGDSRLGTSAAYLAIATAPETALPKVEKLMLEKLRHSRGRKTQAYRDGGEVPAILPDDADRLIELGYALARAGAAAEMYSQPIIDMLSEKIARPAPPFGFMAAPPTEFCRIGRRIGGKVAIAVEAQRFCAKGFKGGDGSPRQF